MAFRPGKGEFSNKSNARGLPGGMSWDVEASI